MRDGNYLWVLLGAAAYKYSSSSGVYQNSSIYIGSQTGDPVGITTDDTNFWVLGKTTKTVYKYNPSGTYQFVNFSVASQTSAPEDITWDGTYFYVIDAYQKVYKYNASGVYQGIAFTTASTPSPKGIVSEGASFFVTGSSLDSVVEYKPAVGIPNANAGAWLGQNYVRVK